MGRTYLIDETFYHQIKFKKEFFSTWENDAILVHKDDSIG